MTSTSVRQPGRAALAPSEPPKAGPARLRRRRRGGRRRLLRLAVAALALLALSGTVGGVWLTRLPGVSDAESRVAALLRAHGATDTGHVPDQVGRATVAVEDERFYSHHGIDVVGVARSAWATITGQPGDHGGSTITQQLARLLYPDAASSPTDAIGIALKLEHQYSKDNILEMYLNAVYLGDGQYGVDAASQRYFGQSPDGLSWAQAALLAGLPQAPSADDPLLHPAAATARQHEVLAALVRTGVLSPQMATQLAAAPLGLRAA